MRKSSLFSIDIYLLSATIILMIIGILFIFSSNREISGEIISNEYIKQIIWVIIGFPVLFLFALANYQRFEQVSHYIYSASILLLIITLIFGKVVYNHKSWLVFTEYLRIQPSEFAKITTILFLGAYLNRVGKKIQNLYRFLLAFSICLLPVTIIFLQRDMGTALVYFPIFITMMWIAGAKKRHILFLVMSGLLMITIVLMPKLQEYIIKDYIPILNIFIDSLYLLLFVCFFIFIFFLAGLGYYLYKQKYFYWISFTSLIFIVSGFCSLVIHHIIMLTEDQIMRFIIFLDPYIAPREEGWHIIRSITTIGSGGFWGKGLLIGPQSHGLYIPRQSTDFIFSIISEEWGFVGGLVVFCLFLVILLRGLKIIYNSKDKYGYYIGGGIIGMIFFHVVVNIGMAMGVTPITGIPLFFVSYGGSSLLTGLISIGILINIYFRRYS